MFTFYCASLLPYFLVGLASELPVHSYPSPLLSATCQRSRTSTQAEYVPRESPSRPLHTSPCYTPALSYLNSHLPPLSLAHWVDLFLPMEGSGICLCCHPHPYSSPLFHHLVTSEFIQTYRLACGFLLVHPTLCGSQALSTSGHTVAWVMAQYLLADPEVGM